MDLVKKNTIGLGGRYLKSEYHKDEIFFDWIDEYCAEHYIHDTQLFRAFVFFYEYFKEALFLGNNCFGVRPKIYCKDTFTSIDEIDVFLPRSAYVAFNGFRWLAYGIQANREHRTLEETIYGRLSLRKPRYPISHVDPDEIREGFESVKGLISDLFYTCEQPEALNRTVLEYMSDFPLSWSLGVDPEISQDKDELLRARQSHGKRAEKLFQEWMNNTKGPEYTLAVLAIDLRWERSLIHSVLDRVLNQLEGDYLRQHYVSDTDWTNEKLTPTIKSKRIGQSFSFRSYLDELGAYRIVNYFKSIWNDKTVLESSPSWGEHCVDPQTTAFQHAYYYSSDGERIPLYRSVNGWKKNSSKKLSFSEIISKRVSHLFPLEHEFLADTLK